MTIGKHCQLCGKKKKPSEVIGEAHGIVVTAPCLMTRVFGDPPTPAAEVRAMVRFCAVCGAEQPRPLPEKCPACASPLTAEAGARELDKKGAPAEFNQRLLAFAIDLVIIALLSALAIIGIYRLEAALPKKAVAAHMEAIENTAEPAAEAESAEPAGEVEKMNVFSLARYTCAVVIFVLYHALFLYFWGASPGKLIMGLRVMLKNGSSDIAFLRALLRSGLYLFTIYVAPIGFIPLIFQEPREQWLAMIEEDAMFHNSLTDTVVIRPRS